MLSGPFRRSAARAAGWAAAVLLLGGCTSGHYRKSADKEVYRILQDYDRRVFGRTNEFTIDTVYSARDPKTIPAAEIIDSRSATNRRVINLSKALELAVQNSREYQTQKEQLYLTALSLTGARYEFGPQFNADSTGQLAGSPSGSDVGSVNSQIGVSQLLKTGGRLAVSLGNDLVRYFTGKPDLVARDSAINLLSVNLSQPLLRGFGINDPTVEQLTQAERNVVYAIRSFSLYQQEFAVATVNDYYRLLATKAQVRNQYTDYTNWVENTRYLEARSVDRETRSEVDNARSSELQSRGAYVSALARYFTQLDAFKTRLGLPISEELYLDEADSKELVDAGLRSVEIDRQAAFRICVEKHMDLLNAIDRFEDSKRKVRIAADQLRPELSLFASGSLESEAPYDYLNFDPNQLRYSAGLRLNLPVDRLRERNNYRSTLVSFESQLRSLAQTLDQYKARIDEGLRSVEEQRLTYVNNLSRLEVAQRRVESADLRQKAGRATIREVREAQDDLLLAQNNVVFSYRDHLIARLNLLIDIGVLDTKPDRFWLSDPLATLLKPEQRAPSQLSFPDEQVLPPAAFLEPTL